MSQVGYIRIKRANNWGCRFASFDIMLNGTQLGSVKVGEEEIFEVPASTYIYLYCFPQVVGLPKSDLVKAYVEPGKTIELECGVYDSRSFLVVLSSYAVVDMTFLYLHNLWGWVGVIVLLAGVCMAVASPGFGFYLRQK